MLNDEWMDFRLSLNGEVCLVCWIALNGIRLNLIQMRHLSFDSNISNQNGLK